MSEYIERDRAVQALVTDYAYAAADIVSKLPADDVVEVKHGRWSVLRKGDWTSVYGCSECHRKVTVGCDSSIADARVSALYPYCHCGAKMDGGVDNG